MIRIATLAAPNQLSRLQGLHSARCVASWTRPNFVLCLRRQRTLIPPLSVPPKSAQTGQTPQRRRDDRPDSRKAQKVRHISVAPRQFRLGCQQGRLPSSAAAATPQNTATLALRRKAAPWPLVLRSRQKLKGRRHLGMHATPTAWLRRLASRSTTPDATRPPNRLRRPMRRPDAITAQGRQPLRFLRLPGQHQ